MHWYPISLLKPIVVFIPLLAVESEAVLGPIYIVVFYLAVLLRTRISMLQNEKNASSKRPSSLLTLVSGISGTFDKKQMQTTETNINMVDKTPGSSVMSVHTVLSGSLGPVGRSNAFDCVLRLISNARGISAAAVPLPLCIPPSSAKKTASDPLGPAALGRWGPDCQLTCRNADRRQVDMPGMSLRLATGPVWSVPEPLLHRQLPLSVGPGGLGSPSPLGRRSPGAMTGDRQLDATLR